MDDFSPDPARRRQEAATPLVAQVGEAQFEYRLITMPRGTSRAEARVVLTEHAEYGRWELARVQVDFGGARRVWLRRRIIRVDRGA